MSADPVRFDVTPEEAIALQKELAPRVRQVPLGQPPRTVAGFDLGFKTEGEMTIARAAAVVLDVTTLETLDERLIERPVDFPYIPGLLSFREAPAILEAYEALSVKPDALMLDGQGLAHPRHFGIACHVGVILSMPSIGAAKSPLVGKGARPGPERGDTAPILYKGQLLGRAVTTRAGTKPIWVSVGNLITLDEAVELVLALSPKYRVPEPTRRAHNLASRGLSSMQSGEAL